MTASGSVGQCLKVNALIHLCPTHNNAITRPFVSFSLFIFDIIYMWKLSFVRALLLARCSGDCHVLMHRNMLGNLINNIAF